jgi:ABC-type nitrate/sulfonate/bicarbonate transport system substrate-binding protein
MSLNETEKVERHMHQRLKRLYLMVALTATAALVVGALSACGSSDSSSSAGETSAGGGSGSMTPVTFQLSWLPGGESMGYFVGKEKGFYEEEGIDLKVEYANDPTLSIKLIASGEKPMGIAYSGDIVFSAAKGSNVTSVFTLTEGSPFGLVSLGKENIKTPKDLAGKTVGVTSLPTDQAYFDNMLEEAGVDKGEVNVVDPGQGGVSQIIQGNLSATSALTEYEPIILKSKGFPETNFMPYSEYGAPDAPFYDIVVNPAWLKEHEDIVEAFLRATRKSFNWTSEHLKEATDIYVEQFPEQEAQLSSELWCAERAIGGNGENKAASFEELNEFFFTKKLISKEVDPSQLYSNAYLPKENEPVLCP